MEPFSLFINENASEPDLLLKHVLYHPDTHEPIMELTPFSDTLQDAYQICWHDYQTSLHPRLRKVYTTHGDLGEAVRHAKILYGMAARNGMDDSHADSKFADQEEAREVGQDAHWAEINRRYPDFRDRPDEHVLQHLEVGDHHVKLRSTLVQQNWPEVALSTTYHSNGKIEHKWEG